MEKGLGYASSTSGSGTRASTLNRTTNSSNSHRRASIQQSPHVLFDEEDEEELEVKDGRVKDKGKGLGKVENHEMKPLTSS